MLGSEFQFSSRYLARPQETLPLPGDAAKDSNDKDSGEKGGGNSMPAADAAAAAAAAPPAADEAPAAAQPAQPEKKLSEEELGKIKTPLSDVRKGVFSLNPGMVAAGPVVDSFALALQAFVFDVTCVNKGSVQLRPPVERGTNSLMMSYTMLKGKDLKEKASIAMDGKLCHVHSLKMSRTRNFNYCGIIIRIPAAGGIQVTEAFGHPFLHHL